MNDDLLEAALRTLRPAALPADLKARMQAPPPLEPATVPWWRNVRVIGAASLAAAAALVWMLVPPPASGPADPAPRAVRIHQTESTLLAERTLAVEEHDGRVWELVEQEWRDDSIALCSDSPVRVRYSETRVERLCQPVDFQ
jgi:hypothetical protein